MESSIIPLFITLSLIAATAGGQNPSQDFLDAHNRARAQVGVQPLLWNDTVAIYARRYAQRADNNCSLVNSGGPYGENLANGTGQLSARVAMRIWLSEMPRYNSSSNSCVGGPCEHYTQVVWNQSALLGCALQQCTNGLFFAICSYDPPGNIAGQRPFF